MTLTVNIEYNNGRNSCDCYGVLEENSNIEIVCYDEEWDTVWTTGNPETDEPFKSWEEALEVLRRVYNDRIEQLEAV